MQMETAACLFRLIAHMIEAMKGSELPAALRFSSLFTATHLYCSQLAFNDGESEVDGPNPKMIPNPKRGLNGRLE